MKNRQHRAFERVKRDQKPRVLLIPQEAIPESGSFEVRYPDGRQSEYFYFEDNPASPAPRGYDEGGGVEGRPVRARQEQDALDRKG